MSKRATQQKVAKLVEDKTFGMKNKKGKKAQTYIAQVEKTARHATSSDLVDERRRFQAKKEAEKRQAEEDWLMGGGSAMKALEKKAKLEAARKAKEDEARKAEEKEEEVDPKTILCQDFMRGLCMLGDQCKFSHDDSKARKSAKIGIYQDPREKNPGFKFTTPKICQHFLDAVEQGKYGHFWTCPNGGEKCVFRHCVPFGFVLKRDAKTNEIEETDISEQIEIERARLDISQCTPVTEELLKDWMVNRKKQRDAEIEKERAEAAAKQGKAGPQVLSGRSLFQLDPSLFKDDEDAAGGDELSLQPSVEQEATDVGDDDQGVAGLVDTMDELTIQENEDATTAPSS